MRWMSSTVEVLGLALCVAGAAIGAFLVAFWLGLIVLGVALVAAVQFAEWVLTAPTAVDAPPETPTNGGAW